MHVITFSPIVNRYYVIITKRIILILWKLYRQIKYIATRQRFWIAVIIIIVIVIDVQSGHGFPDFFIIKDTQYHSKNNTILLTLLSGTTTVLRLGG